MKIYYLDCDTVFFPSAYTYLQWTARDGGSEMTKELQKMSLMWKILEETVHTHEHPLNLLNVLTHFPLRCQTRVWMWLQSSWQSIIGCLFRKSGWFLVIKQVRKKQQKVLAPVQLAVIEPASGPGTVWQTTSSQSVRPAACSAPSYILYTLLTVCLILNVEYNSAAWCSQNNVDLNTKKTKEAIIDLETTSPLIISADKMGSSSAS